MAMNEGRAPETCPIDAERRHDTARERIISALSFTTAFAAVYRYNPDGMIATIIVAAGASMVGAFVWRILWVMSAPLLALLTMMIYLFTIMHALAFALPVIVLAMFAPGVAQLYVIYALWTATGTLLQPLTLMCLAWLALLGVWIFEQNLFAQRHLRSKGPSLC